MSCYNETYEINSPKAKGKVNIKIYDDIDVSEIEGLSPFNMPQKGLSRSIDSNNLVVLNGRKNLAIAITRSFTGEFKGFVDSMEFGTGGTGEVSDTANALQAPVLSKAVIGFHDAVNWPTRAVFMATLSFSDAVGQPLNEMLLRLHGDDTILDGDAFSIVNFGTFTKQSNQSLALTWTIDFI